MPLVAAPANAQADNLVQRVHEDSYSSEVFGDEVLAHHPAPWLSLSSQRATAPPGLRSCDQDKVQKTLGRTPGCKRSIGCALNSCRVVFAAAEMVAHLHRLLLGAAPGRPQIRCAFSFVDEASRHNIPVGLDLAAMGSQCLSCGDAGHLRPYSHTPLLPDECPIGVTDNHAAIFALQMASWLIWSTDPHTSKSGFRASLGLLVIEPCTMSPSLRVTPHVKF